MVTVAFDCARPHNPEIEVIVAVILPNHKIISKRQTSFEKKAKYTQETGDPGHGGENQVGSAYEANNRTALGGLHLGTDTVELFHFYRVKFRSTTPFLIT